MLRATSFFSWLIHVTHHAYTFCVLYVEICKIVEVVVPELLEMRTAHLVSIGSEFLASMNPDIEDGYTTFAFRKLTLEDLLHLLHLKIITFEKNSVKGIENF